MTNDESETPYDFQEEFVIRHRVTFSPSGRTALVPDGATILKAAELASEPLSAECGGRGACGCCLVRILGGQVPEYRVLNREGGFPQAIACLTPVRDSLIIAPLWGAELPKLASRAQNIGFAPLEAWAPWPLTYNPIVESHSDESLGVALDVGTTTLRLLLIRLSDGKVVGEAGAYNPQIAKGADVISRIIAAERGFLKDLSSSIRAAISSMVEEASGQADPSRICAYVVAGNMTMIHLFLAADPSGIRRIPSEPRALAFPPVKAADLGLPCGNSALVHILPAVGGWVGGDVMAGAVRAGFSRLGDGLGLYVDLGTNGEIVLGGDKFAMACACSAGPAFEGGGIRCGMRADSGAIDGVAIDEEEGLLSFSVIGGGMIRGVCGSGLIALLDALFRAGWIDRSGRFTDRMPALHRVESNRGTALRLSQDGTVALWERDLASLIRAKAAIFAGIRSLIGMLGHESDPIKQIVVSGNFGRFLNVPAAIGIGLLPAMSLDRYRYVDNGSLEGAALALLSHDFLAEINAYLSRVTYVDLADIPGYMDEFVAASFIPHTSPERLHLLFRK